jgi:hypothetical protein
MNDSRGKSHRGACNAASREECEQADERHPRVCGAAGSSGKIRSHATTRRYRPPSARYNADCILGDKHWFGNTFSGYFVLSGKCQRFILSDIAVHRFVQPGPMRLKVLSFSAESEHQLANRGVGFGHEHALSEWFLVDPDRR